MYIGANPEGAGLYGVFDGRIDEVAVFEQALTSSQILALSLSDQVNNYVVDEDTTLTITAANGVLANDTDLDGDSLTAVLNTDVSNGTLSLNADGSFDYTPNADWSGTDSFTYTANDGLLDSNVATVTITVNLVSDAPTLNNGALASITEDTANPAGQTVAIIFSGQFSDVDGDSFGGIAVVGNPADAGTQGTWQYSTNGGTNWFAIGAVADDSTALALSSSCLVRFMPVADYNGTPPALTVRGLDDTYVGGYSTTAGSETRINVDTSSNGGTTAIAAATTSLSTLVTPVNDAPVGLPTITGIVTEDQILSVDTSGISDIDGLGVFSHQWLRNGAAIGGATDSTYTLGDDDVGTQISVQASYTDGDGAAESVTSLQTAAVVNVNDVPAARDDRIGLLFDGIDDYVTIGAYAGLSVSTNLTMEAWIKPTGLGTGSQIVINKEGEYELGITADTGQVIWAFDNIDPNWSWHNTGYFAEAGEWTHLAVTYNNGVVETYANGVLVETYNGSGAITDEYPGMNELQIGGRENATTQRFDGAIDEVRIWNTTRNQIEIQTTMNTPLTGAEFGLIGNWRLDEGSGTTVIDQSLLDHDGTLADGVDVAKMPVWKGYVIIEDGTLTVNAANGVLSNDFDMDGDILTAVLDSGPSNADSFTLNPDGSFTYTPTANFNGIDSFTYHANDGSADSNIATVTIRVGPVNDAPLLSGANDLTAINEDPVSNNGTLVSDLIAGQSTDVDAGSLSGIAVTGVDDTNGTWQYTINSGGNWTAFGSPSASAARLLAADADTYVRFVPNANWNGMVTDGITFHAWDQTTGTVGATAELDSGYTLRDEFTTAAYSNDDGTANWATVWIEDDTSGGGFSSGNISVSGQQLVLTPRVAGDSVHRQADLTGATLAMLSFDYTNGLAGAKRIELQISDNGGSSFTMLATFSDADNPGNSSFSADISSYIAGDTQIRFYFTGSSNGIHNLSIDNIEIQYNVATKTGGNSAFSATSHSSDINVTPVNDAPVNTVPGTQTVLEETQTAIPGISVADVDAGSGVIYTQLTATNGILNVSLSGAATLSAGANDSATLTISGTVTDINATLASLRYTGNTNVIGVAADTLTILTNDMGNTGSGGALSDSDNVLIDITPVNDPPVIGGIDTGTVTEDVDPDTGSEPTSDAADSSSRQLLTSWFSIQVSAFPELSTAENEVSRLREKGYDPFYRFEDTGSKGMWYRVYVGRYPTQEEAQQTAEKLIEQRVVKAYLLRKMLAEKDIFYSVTPQDTGLSSADREGDEKGASGPLQASEQAAVDTNSLQTGSSDAVHGRPVQAAFGNGPDRVGSPQSGSTAVRLTLMDAIRYSLEGNREISVAAYDPKQAQAQIEGEESVYDPLVFADSTFRRDPNLDSSVTNIVTEDDGRTRAGIRKPLKTGGMLSTYLETRYADLNNATFPRTYKHIVAPTVELQQPLLNNIGSKKEQTAIKIANFRANISAADFRRKVIDVTTSVASVYWKLFLFKELIDINRVNLDMAEEVHRREAERYARGLSQQLDVARAQSNAQVRRSTLLRSQEEYKLAMDRLKLLLNWQEFTIDSDAVVIPVELPLTAPMDPDETEAITTALSNRPEIIKAQQELRIREVDEKLAGHQQLPTLDAYGRYSISGYGSEYDRAWSDVSVSDDDIWEVGLQFEYAFGNRSAKSQYRRKSLGRLQANAQLKRVKDEIKLDVKQVLHRLATASREIDANRSAKEAAEKVVEGEFTRFDIGQTSNEELLRAQDLLAMTSRSYARAIADYNTTIQELTRAQGVLPDGVTIEEAVR